MFNIVNQRASIQLDLCKNATIEFNFPFFKLINTTWDT